MGVLVEQAFGWKSKKSLHISIVIIYDLYVNSPIR